MNTKVLVADYFDGINWSIDKVLKQLQVVETDYANYCDDAYLKLIKAIKDSNPYNLLICDLNFKTDNRINRLNSGEDLIMAITKIQPDIKIIVFSDEIKSFRIKSLFTNYNIEAFVHKGTNSLMELEKAIQVVSSNDTVNTKLDFENSNHNWLVDIKEYDISILESISYGFQLNMISINLKKLGIKPNSESSVEKSINRLKKYFNAKNNVHLIAISKDLGLI